MRSFLVNSIISNIGNNEYLKTMETILEMKIS